MDGDGGGEDGLTQVEKDDNTIATTGERRVSIHDD